MQHKTRLKGHAEVTSTRKGRTHQAHHHLLNQPLYKYLHFQYERGLSNSFLYIHFLLDSHSWALLFPNSYMCRHANLEGFFLSKSSSVPLMLSFVWQEDVHLQSEIHQESQIPTLICSTYLYRTVKTPKNTLNHPSNPKVLIDPNSFINFIQRTNLFVFQVDCCTGVANTTSLI